MSSSIRKQTTIATLAVMGSRVTGLVREIVFAFFFGASAALDCFIAAFRIPNLLRDLFSEGALSTSFVTVFSKKSDADGDRSAWDLANRIFGFVLIVVGALTVLGIVFSPQLVHLVASGFEGEKFRLAVLLNRLLFPFILFVSLAAIAMGMLNSKGKFALPQSASTFFNLTSILTGLLFAYLMEPDIIRFPLSGFQGDVDHPPGLIWTQMARGMTGMALGTLLGGVVQWIVQMPSLGKLGFRLKPSLFWKNQAALQVLKLTVPAIIGGAAVQINVLINTNFASYLADGSMAWLNYAFRLMQFPIGVFGVAVATATTPAIARLAGQKDLLGFSKTVGESTLLALFLCIPSALGLIVLAKPILSLIYQYGQFSPFDTQQSALALQGYATGLVFYAAIKIFQPAYLALNDAKTPMIISLVSILVNLVLNWILVFVLHFQHWGLALGTSGVALANCLLLVIGLQRKGIHFWTHVHSRELSKILGASSTAVLSAWGMMRLLDSPISVDHSGARILMVLAPITTASLVYYGFSLLLDVREMVMAKEWIARKLKPDSTRTK